MRIKATDMERMFGLSANGIRLYEQHGIIAPRRDGEGAYRVYGEPEMQAMGCGVQLRRYGFTMPQTAQLLGGMDEGAQLREMRGRVDALEEEIEQLTRVRRSLRVHVRRAEQAEALLDRCTVEDKPAMYFLGAHRDGRLLSRENCAQVGEWIGRYAPHLSAALLLDGPYFTREGYDAPPLCGVAVDAEMAIELGLCPSEDVFYLPPKPCVVTGVRSAGEFELEEAQARVRRYARENGLALYAGGLLRLVQCVRRDGRLNVTGLLWAPLAATDGQYGQMR